MSWTDPSRKAALDDFLAQAADDLAQSTTPTLGNDAEGLLFLGAWHQSYPAILVRDPFLSDSAKVHFLYLMQESSQNPQGAIAMPSLEETARVLGQSRKTAGRDRMLLRLCRWISICQTLRDGLGRFRGSIYAIHSEPCSLFEGSRLDRGYLDLLGEAKGHCDPYLSNAAQAALDGIDHALDEGRDPLDPTDSDSIDRRLKAATALKNGNGCFFDLLLTEKKRPAENSHEAHSESKAPGPESYPQNAKFTHGEPCVKFTHGKSQPCVKFTHGTQSADSSEQKVTYPQNSKFTHGYSSSSNKTTTTEEQNSEETFAPALGIGALRWPKQFDDSQRAMIVRAIAREGITADRQQDIVDVLAHKALDEDNPLRSPAGYAIRLCRRIKSGQFQPIAPPASTAPKHDSAPLTAADQTKRELRDMRTEMQRLQGEINGLEQNLIPMAQAENQPVLVASRDRYQAELDALKRQYKTLRDGAGRNGAAGDSGTRAMRQ